MRRLQFVWLLFFAVSCSTNQADTSQSQGQKSSPNPKRIEYSNDTTFDFWDSLLLQYTYNPVKRKLTEFDKEWYVFHDSAERRCGYINMEGDTVIPMKYGYIPYVTDTFRAFALVQFPNRGFVGINKNEEILFDTYFFDNGPDYTSDGLFRIKKESKVGFADEKGNIVIEPIYDEAHPFEHGYAMVGFKCYTVLLGDEHNPNYCRNNGIINKKGQMIYFSNNVDSVVKKLETLRSNND